MNRKLMVLVGLLSLLSGLIAVEPDDSWRFDLTGYLLTPTGNENQSTYFLPPDYGELSEIPRLNISQVTFTDHERLEITFRDGSTTPGVFWEARVESADKVFGLVPTLVLLYIDHSRTERRLEIVIADDRSGYAVGRMEYLTGSIGGYRSLYAVDFGDTELPEYEPEGIRIAP